MRRLGVPRTACIARTLVQAFIASRPPTHLPAADARRLHAARRVQPCAIFGARLLAPALAGSSSVAATRHRAMPRRRRRLFWSAAAGSSADGSPTFEDVLLECNNINSLAHALWARVVQPGDMCVDATAGNGFDTLALARIALRADGSGGGAVLAFDVQGAALAATRARLVAAGVSAEQLARVTLLEACHSTLPRHVAPSSVKLVAFNLGFLPQKEGSAAAAAAANRDCTTTPATTVAALHAAAEALVPGGLISCMTYTGHPGGAEEAAAVDAFAAALPPRQWTATQVALLNRVGAPRLVLLYRRHCGVAPEAAAR